jgi:hypothetical protein
MARSTPSDGSGPTRSGLTAAAGVAGVVLVVVLLALAAGQRPGRVFEGNGVPEGPRAMQTPSSPTASTDSFGQPDQTDRAGHRSVFYLVIPLIVGGVALWLVWFLIRVLVVLFQRWEFRRRPPPPPEIAFDVLEHPEVLAEDMVAEAERYRALLTGGSPRNGIVACWHEFERAAERRGLAREPWQTSAEFTLRMLDLLLTGSAGDGGAVGRLAVHYREARFSDHEVTEADRDEARQDLDAILAALATRRAGSPS